MYVTVKPVLAINKINTRASRTGLAYLHSFDKDLVSSLRVLVSQLLQSSTSGSLVESKTQDEQL